MAPIISPNAIAIAQGNFVILSALATSVSNFSFRLRAFPDPDRNLTGVQEFGGVLNYFLEGCLILFARLSSDWSSTTVIEFSL